MTLVELQEAKRRLHQAHNPELWARIELTPEQWEAFCDLVENPPAPTEALLELFRHDR